MEDGAGTYHYSVEAHDAPLPEGLRLVDSLQSGPRLLPDLTLEQPEAFVRSEADGHQSDSIGGKTLPRHAPPLVLCDNGGFMLLVWPAKNRMNFRPA